MSSFPDIDDAWAPAARADLSIATIDGELVIFDPLTSEIHQLDPVGTIVWQFLDGEATIGDLVTDLASVFEVPEAQIRADVATLMALLTEHGLLEGMQALVADPNPTEVPDTSYLVDPPAP